MRRLLPVLVAAALVAGCGAENSAKQARLRSTSSSHCRAVGHGYTICGYPARGAEKEHSTIELGGKRIAGPLEQRGGRRPLGYWRSVALSPDGQTLLAQWSGECEIPTAFFIPARGGKPRVVTGERDWRKAPESIARGWTASGRAWVALPHGACGSGARRPGVYLIDPRTGRMTFERRLTGPVAQS